MTITKRLMTFAVGIFFSVAAAAENIAVVDVQAIVSQLPQMAAIQKKLTEEFAAPAEAIKKLESDIKFNVEKFQRESATMSAEQQTELRGTIEKLQKEYQAKAQPLQENMRRRQAEERNGLLAVIQNAINAIAAEEKIDLVLDGKAVAFVTPEHDISAKVVEKVSKLK